MSADIQVQQHAAASAGKDQQMAMVVSGAGDFEESKLGEEALNLEPAVPAPTGCFPKLTTPRIFSPRSYFSSLTPRTKAAFEEAYVAELAAMRERFPGQKDYDMVPFLRAANGNVKDAAKAYEETLQWRAATLPIARDSCEGALRKSMFYFRGLDKEGRPVAYLSLRGHDPKTRDLDECMRAILYRVEQVVAAQGQKEFQVTVVIDRVGTDSKNQDSEMMKSFLKVFSERYPMKLNKVLICPTNTLFRTLWAGIKYTLPERSRSKVTMLADARGLSEFIDASQLPQHLGGTDVFDPASDL